MSTENAARWEQLADLIDAGRNAIDRGRAHPERAVDLWQGWCDRWLGQRVEARRAGRRISPLTLLEAMWLTLEDLKPPTAQKVRDTPREARRSRKVWRKLPENFPSYLRTAIAEKAVDLDAQRESLEAYDGFELDRRAAQRRERDRGGYRRYSRAQPERGTEDPEAARQALEADMVAAVRKVGGVVAEEAPAGMCLRDLSRFTRDERQLHYLNLLAADWTKSDAQREAGITRTDAIALEGRIKRGHRDPG